jgi:hypothetical protein
VIGGVTQREQAMQNTLFMNRGDGTWAEVAELSGVEASGWTWSALFLDVDLDGYEDLLLGNGHAYDVQNADAQTRINMLKTRVRTFDAFRQLVFEYPPLDQHNAAFRNRGDGTFEAVPSGWGIGAEADVSHGMATGDFDRDGDLDVVVSRLNAPVGIYRNTAGAPRVGVRLRGAAPNTQGIGAKVRVRPVGAGAAVSDEDVVPMQGMPVQEKEMVAGGQYLSDSEAQVAFGVGEAERVVVEVKWPGGGRSEVEGAADRLYEIYAPGVPVPAGPVPDGPVPGGPEEGAPDSRADSTTITHNMP